MESFELESLPEIYVSPPPPAIFSGDSPPLSTTGSLVLPQPAHLLTRKPLRSILSLPTLPPMPSYPPPPIPRSGTLPSRRSRNISVSNCTSRWSRDVNLSADDHQRLADRAGAKRFTEPRPGRSLPPHYHQQPLGFRDVPPDPFTQAETDVRLMSTLTISANLVERKMWASNFPGAAWAVKLTPKAHDNLKRGFSSLNAERKIRRGTRFVLEGVVGGSFEYFFNRVRWISDGIAHAEVVGFSSDGYTAAESHVAWPPLIIELPSECVDMVNSWESPPLRDETQSGLYRWSPLRFRSLLPTFVVSIPVSVYLANHSNDSFVDQGKTSTE